ncbi:MULTISPECIES: ABC transporter ATP-binding protein [unclassified Enterococcus]|uniref:ABC transporter ATP-binding protein n=1 Tax=unclassified Enterococcus TaxID=2608891 RepID=UPI002476ADD7|nr:MULTISPECIES: ABC transporter ATP-binding protein [unclassified Enterococcus]
MLNLKNIQKTYQTESITTDAINNLNLEVFQGSFVGIMGASGSGKTTLLNMIATIDKPTSGSIEINGQDIATISEKDLAKFRREHLGFVFQEYNLLETLTIKEIAKEKIAGIIDNLASKLEITAILDKYPYEVSGGQRQRCACARAMATNPSIILADEPTGALDSRATKQLLEAFSLLWQEFGATILMVTHDALSASYCDEILFLEDGEIKANLKRQQQGKQAFFTNILDTLAQMEAQNNYVL